MEYMDMVEKIVSVEHAATALVQEGKTREEHLKADLAQEVAELRTRYLARARHRLTMVAETEAATAQETVTMLDEKHQIAMAQVEVAYEKNKAAWTESLFSMIVGTPL